jgi:hypothetical protein
MSEEQSWNCWTGISDQVKVEIRYMLDELPGLNGYPMRVTSSVFHNRVMASDASEYAVAAAEVNCLSISGGPHQAHFGPCVSSPLVQRLLEWDERDQSSTFRELLGVWDCYVKHAESFQGTAVLHLCDNANVSLILRKGSGKPALQALAIAIFKSCRLNKIHLSSLWLPRTDARIAVVDVMSKWADLSDWGLADSVFEELCSRANTFEVDVFAADFNFRVPVFFSPVASELASAINAFSQNWRAWGFAFVCPPVKMIIPTIKHIILSGGSGVLVVPRWPASSFWRFLCSDGRHLNRLFLNCFSHHFELKSGPMVKSKMFRGIPSFKMLILSYNAGIARPMHSNISRDSCMLDGCDFC